MRDFSLQNLLVFRFATPIKKEYSYGEDIDCGTSAETTEILHPNRSPMLAVRAQARVFEEI
jgi:hypothetical protein